MSNFNQLLLFELTEEERIEIAGYLEFDFVRFPAPRNSFIPFDNVGPQACRMECDLWVHRSYLIDVFIDKHFKIKS